MDDIYQNLQDNGTFDKYNNIEVLDNTSDICIKINEFYTQIKSKKILRQKTFILWLGYPDVFDEFNVSPPKKDVKFAGESIVEAEEHVEINIQKALLDEKLTEDFYYIDENILPLYEDNIGGHDINHINYFIFNVEVLYEKQN